MIVNELSKELGVKNKDLIDFLKSKNFKVSSHMQTLTDVMIETVKNDFICQDFSWDCSFFVIKVAVEPVDVRSHSRIPLP